MQTRNEQQQTPAAHEAVRIEGPTRPTRAPTWLITVTVVLAIGFVALGAWMLFESASQPDAMTADEVTALVDGQLDAMNAGDMGAYGAYYAEDAVFEDQIAGEVLEGREEIVARAQSYYNDFGFSVIRVSDIVMAGDNVAVWSITYGDDESRAVAMMMGTYEDGKISQELVWAVEDVKATT